jgi:hypothetical protein
MSQLIPRLSTLPSGVAAVLPQSNVNQYKSVTWCQLALPSRPQADTGGSRVQRAVSPANENNAIWQPFDMSFRSQIQVLNAFCHFDLCVHAVFWSEFEHLYD